MDNPGSSPPLTRQEYIAALQRALAGLPADVQAKTLAFYEQRFVDEAARGRSEADVAQELGDPARIAMTLRASSHLSQLAAEQAKPGRSPGSIIRVGLTAIGLTLFNLFMLVPATVFASLLFSLYVGGLASYLGGIGVTAAGFASISDVTVLPLDVQLSGDDERKIHSGVRIAFSKHTGITVTGDQLEAEEAVKPRSGRSDSPRIRVNQQLDGIERTTQTAFGIVMIAAGIALFLLALVISRLTWLGLKHYWRMHLALLRGT